MKELVEVLKKLNKEQRNLVIENLDSDVKEQLLNEVCGAATTKHDGGTKAGQKAAKWASKKSKSEK